jgi:hypothetical protein
LAISIDDNIVEFSVEAVIVEAVIVEAVRDVLDLSTAI